MQLKSTHAISCKNNCQRFQRRICFILLFFGKGVPKLCINLSSVDSYDYLTTLKLLSIVIPVLSIYDCKDTLYTMLSKSLYFFGMLCNVTPPFYLYFTPPMWVNYRRWVNSFWTTEYNSIGLQCVAREVSEVSLLLHLPRLIWLWYKLPAPFPMQSSLNQKLLDKRFLLCGYYT